MKQAGAAPGPQRGRSSRRFRRLGRITAWLLLTLLVVIVLLYLLRSRLLVPLLRGPVERALAAALDAGGVEIGAIDGDWFSGIEVRDVAIRDGRGLLRSLQGAALAADFSLLALLRGDLTGLRRAAITAKEVAVALPAGNGTAGAGSGEPFALPDLAPWRGIAAEGVTVRIERLRVVGAGGERQGPFALDLQPGARERELRLDFAGTQLVARLLGADAGHAEVALDVAEPGGVLDMLGLGIGVQQGSLHAEMQVERAPLAVRARLDLQGLRGDQRQLGQSHIEASLDQQLLQVPSAAIDLPGINVQLRGVSAPSPLAGQGLSLAAVRGDFALRIDDLAAYAARLPAGLRELLPIHGTLRGAVAGGALRLDGAELQSRDFRLAVQQGSVTLPTADWRGAAGALAFTAALHGEQHLLPADLGTASVDGTVTGRLSGSVAEPQVELQLDLDACRGACRGTMVAFAAARGALHLRAGELGVDDLQVRGLQVQSLASGLDGGLDGGLVGGDVRLTASLPLLPQLELAALSAQLDASSELPAALLAPLCAELQLGPPPRGPVALQLVLRHTEGGAELTMLHVQTAAGSPLACELEGAGLLPLSIAPGRGLEWRDRGAVRMQLHITSPGPEGALLPVQLSTTAVLGRDGLQLSGLELRSGIASLRGELGVRPDFGALLRGELQPNAVPLRADVTIDHVDLGALPASWRGGLRLQGQVEGRIAARGTLARPEPDVQLSLHDVALADPRWPALADLAGELRATRSALTVTALHGLAADGALAATAALDAGAAPLWLGWRDAALQLDLDIQNVALAALTPLLPAPLAGSGTLALQLRGSLARPEVLLRSNGTVRDWAAAVAGGWPAELPRLPAGALDWQAELHASWNGAVIDRFELTAGAAPEARLQVTASGPLPLAWSPDAGLVAATAGALQFSYTMDLPAAAPTPAIGLQLRARVDSKGAHFEPSQLQLARGGLVLQGDAGFDWPALLRGTQSLADVPLQGHVTLRDLTLADVPPAILGLPVLRGDLAGEVALKGTLQPPVGLAAIQHAELTLRHGELKAEGLPRVEQFEADFTIDPHAVTLQSLRGSMGAGQFTAKGALQSKAALATFPADAVLDLTFTGQDVLVFRGEGARLRASPHIVVKGPLQDLLVGGELVVGRGSKYVRRISLIPDLGARGGSSASSGLQLFELPPPFGDHVRFDLELRTSEPFEIRTNVVDGELGVAARLRGKGSEPHLEGTLALQQGILRFPGANLKVDSGVLTFTPANPLYPEVLVRAEGKRMGIQITATMTGRYDRPEVLLSSMPPLPPQDLITLLTTGQLPSTLTERGMQSQARFVGGYLAQEVIQSWVGSDSTERGDSIFDRLTIESGREVSTNGVESLLVELALSDRFALQAERDKYEDYNMGVVLRFRF